ncbi:type VI secretion system protein VasI [Vibrio cholerae]|nr:type VI secretion system protein VasI [Vibrio cholerae]
MRITVLVVSLILGCAGSAHVFAASQDAGSQVEQAELCREIPARLERLACFDRVFATPLEQVAIAPSNPYPAEWQRAMAALSESQSEAGWVLGTQGEGRAAALGLLCLRKIAAQGKHLRQCSCLVALIT